MSAYYKHNSGDRLYQSLPEIYREKDRDSTLAENQRHHLYDYLQSLGDVLDQTRHTLHQNYLDQFPENDGTEQCQDWLLPYFADLFAVNLASQDPDSQRQEISNAVRWAQRKGTMAVIDEITDALTLQDGVVQEGWKRVATTARIGLPLLPAMALGETEPQFPDVGANIPSDAGRLSATSKHPGSPSVTPDLRHHSRAIETTAGNPTAQTWCESSHAWQATAPKSAERPELIKRNWRQVHSHAVSCAPGSYMDVSQRTVDIRDADSDVGHYHAKNLLIYLPPPIGMCSDALIKFAWDDDLDTIIPGTDGKTRSEFIEKTETLDGWTIFRNKTAGRIEITKKIDFKDSKKRVFERLSFRKPVKFFNGFGAFVDCLIFAVAYIGDHAQSSLGIGPENFDQPDLNFKNCLIRSINAPKALIRGEYITVMRPSNMRWLQITDSILLGNIKFSSDNSPSLKLNPMDGSCIRFTRLGRANYNLMPVASRKNNHLTTDKPTFYETNFCSKGYGVLNPQTPSSISQGAEDGGELGAFHKWKYSAQLIALEQKLHEYLPAGLRPIVLRDDILRCPPSRQIKKD